MEKKLRKKHVDVKDKNNKKITQSNEVCQESSIPEAPSNMKVEQMIITTDEIKKAIGALKNKKAPGSDHISSQNGKKRNDENLGKNISEDIKHFSKMLVTPVFKKDESCKAENCRAIALLPIPGKVFDRVILEKI